MKTIAGQCATISEEHTTPASLVMLHTQDVSTTSARWAETLACWFLEEMHARCAPCAAADMFCRLYSVSWIMRPHGHTCTNMRTHCCGLPHTKCLSYCRSYRKWTSTLYISRHMTSMIRLYTILPHWSLCYHCYCMLMTNPIHNSPCSFTSTMNTETFAFKMNFLVIALKAC